MLSPHNLLVAAIFIPYVVMMAGLFAYICWTGQPRDRSDEDEPPDSGDEGRDDVLLAA